MSKIKPGSGSNVIIEDAEIIFRNFSGKAKEFNEEGDRNFCVVFTPEQGRQLKEAGWNMKQFKARPDDEEEPNYYVEVAVEYRKGRPPRCVMVNSKGRVDLGLEEISMFDWVDIKKADLIINPYPWNKGGNSGIKAYVKSLFITINEDELEQMYADVPESHPGRQSAAELEPAEVFSD